MRIYRYFIVLLMFSVIIISLGAGGRTESQQLEMPENGGQEIAESEGVKPITSVPGSISDYEDYPVAVFAGGCFWGVESLFERMPGVLDAVSGYTGGDMEFPTYRYVLSGNTGHVEAVAVFYDPELTSYEELAKYFFEIHDPTQVGGQGPDIGEQYESVIFYNDDTEKQTAEQLIQILESLGYDIATRVEPRDYFYRAEGYHQDYYVRNGSQPYCHAYVKRFP